MFKFLFKLAVIAIAIYLLMQVPFFAKYGQQLRADIMEKVNNVTAEAERIDGKIDEAKQKIEEVKKTGENVINTVSETSKTLEKGLDTINKTTEALNKALKTNPVSPEGTTPPATQPVTEPAASASTPTP